MGQSANHKAADELRKIIHGDVFCDPIHRAAYSSDASIYQIIPQIVICPKNTSDVSAAVQYARKRKIPIAARGTASGVAGESLCEGIVLDMTRYTTKILGYNRQNQTVTCQPGTVLNDLNEYLSGFGRKIGPDPSSANRAVVAGCVANNATGAHCLAYGHIANHVESLQAVLADGSIVEITNKMTPDDCENEKLFQITQNCLKLLSENKDIIKNAQPATRRNRSGYNIAGVCHDGNIDLAKMLVGSEGTLAIFTEITLCTVEIPKFTALMQFEFDSLDKMAKAVPIIVDTAADACELMDKKLIEMAVDAISCYSDVLPLEANSILLVEHSADSAGELKSKMDKTKSAVAKLAYNCRDFYDEADQERLWKSRKDAVPLLYRIRGKKRPVPFIEDVSVENTKLDRYILGLNEICTKFDMEMSYYGHAGDGELHMRPYLDLSDAADIEKMKKIAEEVFSLAWSLGGSISGEHADGLVRAAFIRDQYGDEYYRLLREIKKIFDPDQILNPGKIINDDPYVMTGNLKDSRKMTEKFKSGILIGHDELIQEIRQCNGCGLCRSNETTLRMCPIFKAMGEELASSRAKVNVIRAWMSGLISEEDFQGKAFKEFLRLCVNCKACSVQCPSGVDISKIITAARAEYTKRRSQTKTEMVLSKNRFIGIFGSLFSGITNFVMGLDITKWFMEKLLGIDKRRSMPVFDKGSFLKKGRKWLAQKAKTANPIDKVVYFIDTFANYNDHELGFAVLKVLLQNNIEVVLADQRPAPIPAVVYGGSVTATKDMGYIVKHLADFVRSGYKVVCSEPSAAMCLKQELKHYINTPDAKMISENTFELMGYLYDLYKKDKLKTIDKKRPNIYAYHCPCHILAMGDVNKSLGLLKEYAGLDIKELNAGCCGLAGTFGMQKKNYPLSEKISERLKGAIADSGLKEILTECAMCGMQIEHISTARFIHPIKILADLY